MMSGFVGILNVIRCANYDLLAAVFFDRLGTPAGELHQKRYQDPHWPENLL
jgi:hypothetical protein